MSTPKVRIGLVGAGAIAHVAELPAMAAHPDVQIAGVVTATPESAERNLRRWPIERAYGSVEEMIADARLDALMVLTPKQDHTRFVVAGLEASLDVFCEKPLTTDLAEARELAERADEAGRLLMVGFNRRYAEVYTKARREFETTRPQFCVAQKNRPGSEYRATIENAIHMVDLLRWFCGEAVEITAHANYDDQYAEDGTMALLRFDSGAVGALIAARSAGEWDERLDAYGGLTSVQVTAPDQLAVTREGETRSIGMRPRYYGWAAANTTMGFRGEIDHFVDRVRDRQRPLTDAYEAIRTQELVYEILDAAGLPLTDRDI